MSSFGASHRQLVQDTNAGAEVAPPSVATTSKATISPQTKEIIGTENRLGGALVDVAQTAAKPIIAEQKRLQELAGYDAAGKAEGKQLADGAAGVWHNKLFGANASLRGAQERIAEDNARNLYLNAQHLLKTGGADSWDDEKWQTWKDEQISNEVNKYESDGMKNLVTTSMGKDFQKLERDRGYLHQQYVQQENNNVTMNALDNIAKTYIEDKGSDLPTRSIEDAEARLNEVNELKAKSGISDKAFASAVAQTAASQLSKGNKEFSEWATENGYFDDLNFDQQKSMESAERIYDIKHAEEYSNRADEIWGPTGHIARGNENKTIEAFNALARDYPEAIPEGGTNQIRKQVKQKAFENSEMRRVQRERDAHVERDLRNGQSTTFIRTNALGMAVGFETPTPEARMRGLQRLITGDIDNSIHGRRKLEAEANGDVYEPSPISQQERSQAMLQHSERIGSLMEANSLVIPEVVSNINGISSDIRYSIGEEGFDTESLSDQITQVKSLYQKNPRVHRLLSEDSATELALMETVHEMMQEGFTGLQIAKELDRANALDTDIATLRGTPTKTNAGTSDGGGGGSATDTDLSSVKLPALPFRVASNNRIVSETDTSRGFLGIELFGGSRNTDNIFAKRDEYYKELAAPYKNQITPFLRRSLLGEAEKRVIAESAIIESNGKKTLVHDLGPADRRLKEAGWEDGLSGYIEEAGNDLALIDDIFHQSGGEANGGIRLTPGLLGGNPITRERNNIVPLADGEIMLELLKEDGTTFRYRMDLPDPTLDPESQEYFDQLPIQEQERRNRLKYGLHTLTTDPDKWKKETGQQDTPRDQFHWFIGNQIINDDEMGPEILRRAGHDPDSIKLGQTFKRADLISHITEDEIMNWYPPNTYAAILMERETKAVDKQVNKVERIERTQDKTRGAEVRKHSDRMLAREVNRFGIPGYKTFKALKEKLIPSRENLDDALPLYQLGMTHQELQENQQREAKRRSTERLRRIGTVNELLREELTLEKRNPHEVAKRRKELEKTLKELPPELWGDKDALQAELDALNEESNE